MKITKYITKQLENMENVREILNKLNQFSSKEASALDKKVVLDNGIIVTYRVKENVRNENEIQMGEMVFQAVLCISLGDGDSITWGCESNEENFEVVRWFYRREKLMDNEQRKNRDRDTQKLKSLIELNKGYFY